MSEEIPYFSIVLGDEESIDLDYYFDDDDVLVYDATIVDGVDVSFVGPIMKIKINSNFSEYSRFKVSAFDGIVKTLSNPIYVFLEGGEIFFEGNDSESGGIIYSGDNSENNIITGASNNSDVLVDTNGHFKWTSGVLLVFGILFFVWGIGFFVYFFILKMGISTMPKGTQNIILPKENKLTNDYVKKLG